jgi:hypothetical protein
MFRYGYKTRWTTQERNAITCELMSMAGDLRLALPALRASAGTQALPLEGAGKAGNSPAIDTSLLTGDKDALLGGLVGGWSDFLDFLMSRPTQHEADGLERSGTSFTSDDNIDLWHSAGYSWQARRRLCSPLGVQLRMAICVA